MQSLTKQHSIKPTSMSLSAHSNVGKHRTLKDCLFSLLKLSFCAILGFGAFQYHASDEKVDLKVSSFTPPKALDLKTPLYPAVGLKRNREAWVYLYYVVDQDGKVNDINVFDSLGGSDFENAAKRALRRSKYEPATLDGNPISTTRSGKYRFEFDPPAKSASRKFIAIQQRFQEQVLNGDQAAADSILEDLRERAKTLYEYAWLGFAEFTYHRKWGTKHDQLQALAEAIAYEPAAHYLPRDVFHSALASKTILEFQLQNYQVAMSNYHAFLRLDTGKDDFEAALKPYADRVHRLREERTPFAKTDEFDHLGRWSYCLLWNSFALDLSEPPNSDLMLRCPRQSVTFEYQANLKYEVPDSAGNCLLFVEGSPNSALTLYQL